MSPRPLGMSDAEKLIILMICDIIDGNSHEIDTNFIRNAISKGQSWAIRERYDGILGTDVDGSIVSEVYDILDMCWAVEDGFSKLSTNDKNLVQSNVGDFSGHAFRGFDGNHEIEYMGVAQFMINDMGKYEIFSDRPMNSHAPMLGRYRNMVNEYKKIAPKKSFVSLDANDIINIMK